MKTLPTKNIIAITVIAASIISFLSCQKTDSSNVAPNQPPVTVVTASVAGRVTDISNVPVGNASVSAGVYTTTTDINGQFILKNIQLNKDTGFVKITKPGYFLGSRTFLVNANTTNNVKIQLIPKTVSGNFDAASGGNINVAGGGSVNFGANNVVNESNGTKFAGSVSVSTFYLNPADANFNKYMPGDLRGLNASGQQNILQSFGMLLVEMNDANGGKLQIASGKTAAITIPIPSSMQTSTPATMPLWYFDETKGLWKQEGTATRQGNNYVGTVSHFSFWTAGQLSQSIELSATFTLDTTGIAYANKLVTISRANFTTTNGYTDSSGTVSGFIPANEVLTMKVYSDCGDVVFSRNIGPFGKDSILGSISILNDVCYSTDTSQYINLSFNGNSYIWPSFKIKEYFQPGSSTMIMAGDPNATDGSTLFEGLIFGGNSSPGSYPISIYTKVNATDTYQAGGMSYDPNYNYPTTAVTKFEAIGGYIEGTISGWIKTFPSTATADSFIVSGNYRVKRTQ